MNGPSASGPREEEDAIAAAELLMQRLIQCEPAFEDEDVVSESASNLPHDAYHSSPRKHVHHEDSPSASQSSHMSPSSAGLPLSQRLEAKLQATAPTVQSGCLAAVQAISFTDLKNSRKTVIDTVKVIKKIHGVVWPRVGNKRGAQGFRRYVERMDRVMQSFVVYANVSPHVKGALEGDLITIMNEVCTPMRLLNAGFSVAASQADSPAASSPSRGSPGKSPSRGRGGRSAAVPVPSPLPQLKAFLDKQPTMPTHLKATVMQTCAMESCLDRALPPAVCSSRFEGLQTAVHEKKAALIAEITANRAFISSVIKGGDLEIISHLVITGAYALPKSRVKAYDRLVAEGLMGLLKEKLMRARTKRAREAGEDAAVICRATEILMFLTDPNMDSAYEDPPEGSRPSRGRVSEKVPTRCSSWATDEFVGDVLYHLMNLIVANKDMTSAAVAKVTEVVTQCAKFGGDVLATVIGAIDRILDQIVVYGVWRLSSIIIEVCLQPESGVKHSPTVSKWFTGCLHHERDLMRDSGKTERSITRAEEEAMIPMLKFATDLVTKTQWRIGLGSLLARATVVSRSIIAEQEKRRRKSLAYGVAFQCVHTVSAVADQLVELERSASALPSQTPRRTPARSSRNASNANSNGKRTREGTSPPPGPTPPPAPPTTSGFISPSPANNPPVVTPTPRRSGTTDSVWIGESEGRRVSASPPTALIAWTDRIGFGRIKSFFSDPNNPQN